MVMQTGFGECGSNNPEKGVRISTANENEAKAGNNAKPIAAKATKSFSSLTGRKSVLLAVRRAVIRTGRLTENLDSGVETRSMTFWWSVRTYQLSLKG